MQTRSNYSNLSPSNHQSQLDVIYFWSSTWQLNISYSKCNILPIGPHQTNNTFHIDNIDISIVEHSIDLGNTIDSKLSFHQHINNIVCKANQRESLILRCFLSRSPPNLVRAFKVYVRPLIEYASTTWSPSYVTQIITLESVQHDFTRHIPGCSHLNYHDRLSVLKLQSLEHRRLIADLALCFNIFKCNTCLNFENFFTLNPNTNLRGHPFKLSVPLARNNTRKFFFYYYLLLLSNKLFKKLSQKLLAVHRLVSQKIIHN